MFLFTQSWYSNEIKIRICIISAPKTCHLAQLNHVLKVAPACNLFHGTNRILIFSKSFLSFCRLYHSWPTLRCITCVIIHLVWLQIMHVGWMKLIVFSFLLTLKDKMTKYTFAVILNFHICLLNTYLTWFRTENVQGCLREHCWCWMPKKTLNYIA